MTNVGAAEKEASEVLHSLLSVERIVKQDARNRHSTHELFSEHFPQNITQQNDVVWNDQTLQVNDDTDNLELYVESVDTGNDVSKSKGMTNANNQVELERGSIKKRKVLSKRNGKKKIKQSTIVNPDPTKLEESALEVKERFKRGCECQDESCFRGLSAESVYKHRLNIAELTKGEHDMYLMGVTMACLANPDITVRHKERRRLRAQYVYQGRRVCLDAFLYLENCTHYQIKRIRKHVMTHGVAPRVHGNHGKKPHNTFSLNIYQHATKFLKQYLETHTGETNISNSKNPILLPCDITRKNLHNAYQEYCQILDPGVKLMGYSTFRHFMKEQFPHVKFCKIDPKNFGSNHQLVLNSNSQPNTDQTTNQNEELKFQSNMQASQPQQMQTTILTHPISSSQSQQPIQTTTQGNSVPQVIPLVVTHQADRPSTEHQQATFLVTHVPQLIPSGGNIVMQTTPHNGNGDSSFPYQIANTGYMISDTGNIVTQAMTTQHHQTYAFSRM